MMMVSPSSLDKAKQLISSYKENHIPKMTPELWKAKKVVDSTLHPDNGEPVFLPFRMSSYVVTNLIVTGGMLTPGLKVLLHPLPFTCQPSPFTFHYRRALVN